jgi:hypothetical protein
VPVLALLAAAIGLGVILALSARERARARQARAGIFQDCLGLLDEAAVTIGEDGFPRLHGRIAGRRVRIDAIPDTLTLRRLPQLWLSVTLEGRIDGRAAFGLLLRSTGAEPYALTHRLDRRLAWPDGLPAEGLCRGAGAGAKALVERGRPAVAALLADPRVKEVAATPRGVRAVLRLAEGQRGAHLILRQAEFGAPRLQPCDALRLLDGLADLMAALEARPAVPTADQRRLAS